MPVRYVCCPLLTTRTNLQVSKKRPFARQSVLGLTRPSLFSR